MKTTYQGSCHCDAVKFEVDADIDHVSICDCSICKRRGALSFRVAGKDLRFLTPLSNLSVYRWGTRTAADYFCPVCGILPYRRPRTLSDEERAQGGDIWAVNVRCLTGIDASSLPVRHGHGSQLPLP